MWLLISCQPFGEREAWADLMNESSKLKHQLLNSEFYNHQDGFTSGAMRKMTVPESQHSFQFSSGKRAPGKRGGGGGQRLSDTQVKCSSVPCSWRGRHHQRRRPPRSCLGLNHLGSSLGGLAQYGMGSPWSRSTACPSHLCTCMSSG